MGSSSIRFAGRPRRRAWMHALAALAVAAPIFAAGPHAAAEPAMAGGRVQSLRLFMTSPVLVRAGEQVTIPLDAVCTTVRGTTCPATVRVSVRPRGRSWTTRTVAARPGLRFDLSRLLARTRAARAYDVRVSATAPDGSTASIPAAGEGRALHVYSVPELPAVAVALADPSQSVDGDTALFLPWGSGPDHAGLAPGFEASTIGPSSFDVDAEGRVVLVDDLQRRVAWFDHGSLAGQALLALGPRSDVALVGDGSAYVSSTSTADPSVLTAERVAPDGEVGPAVPFGVANDSLSELRTAGDAAFARVLPLDAWLPLTVQTPAVTGMPLEDGSRLLKVVSTDHSVRLARVVDGEARDAVELVFTQNVGEIALAEPDGAGGYLAVVHLWQEVPEARDFYDVVHVDASHSVRSFVVARQDFAEAMPLSTFRLGHDGALYQLTSASDGVRVVRYDLGGIR